MPAVSNERPTKRVKIEENDVFQGILLSVPQLRDPGLDAQINDILDEFNDIIEVEQLQKDIAKDTASELSPKDLSLFEMGEVPHSSITSPELTPLGKAQDDYVSTNTVLTLKLAMANTSRLIGTFTALKSTYLKLCKEFNYLLTKFNENEKIKIELIHENNQLRKLLVDTIKEKELDRKKYKSELAQVGNIQVA